MQAQEQQRRTQEQAAILASLDAAYKERAQLRRAGDWDPGIDKLSATLHKGSWGEQTKYYDEKIMKKVWAEKDFIYTAAGQMQADMEQKVRRDATVGIRLQQKQTTMATNNLSLSGDNLTQIVNRNIKRDAWSHQQFVNFMNGIETAAKNAIEKLFAVNRKGRFVVNYVKTVTKNGVAVVVQPTIKTILRIVGIPRTTRYWFSKAKRQVIAFARFAHAYNQFGAAATGLRKAQIYSVNEKALKDRKYQSARNWIRTKLRYVVGARRKQKAAQILRIVPNRNNYKIALFQGQGFGIAYNAYISLLNQLHRVFQRKKNYVKTETEANELTAWMDEQISNAYNFCAAILTICKRVKTKNKTHLEGAIKIADLVSAFKQGQSGSGKLLPDIPQFKDTYAMNKYHGLFKWINPVSLGQYKQDRTLAVLKYQQRLADLEKRDDLRQTFSVGDKRKYLYGEGRGELDMGLNAPQKKFHTKLWELPDESMNIEEQYAQQSQQLLQQQQEVQRQAMEIESQQQAAQEYQRNISLQRESMHEYQKRIALMEEQARARGETVSNLFRVPDY